MTALRSFPITRVDAFADRPFTGNPAAVMPLDDWLADDVLQAMAAENNLAETAFLVPDESGEADYELRWFTPAIEGRALRPRDARQRPCPAVGGTVAERDALSHAQGRHPASRPQRR
jgi:hypothetical protein